MFFPSLGGAGAAGRGCGCRARPRGERAQVRSCAGMYDRQLLARLHGSRSPYDMQHGSERRLLGRLLGPATMNTPPHQLAARSSRDRALRAPAGQDSGLHAAPPRWSAPNQSFVIMTLHAARPVRAGRIRCAGRSFLPLEMRSRGSTHRHRSLFGSPTRPLPDVGRQRRRPAPSNSSRRARSEAEACCVARPCRRRPAVEPASLDGRGGGSPGR